MEARGLRKAFGETVALDGLDLCVEPGRIVGLLGPNGAGKSTALHALLGLVAYEGYLRVLGRDPWSERDVLMRDVAFVADVAVLPRWLRVGQALDYVGGVHPRFDRRRAEHLLSATGIALTRRVRDLSKGLVTQVHLALALAIDARLLVLDEPTLGLDALFRGRFYETLLHDYLDRERTILLTTHEVQEVQHVLTDVVFLHRGRVRTRCGVDEIASRYAELTPAPGRLEAARDLAPLHERESFGRRVLLFEGVERRTLHALGDVRTPGLEDLFAALVGDPAGPVGGPQ
jgi:ABC-2 type transport system ATP-binding protein